ncbi:MAG: twin transmembrane helix small protein [Proteobacteria bacterium]|nr:twin transmembrane helix small protein [Pseudomonadota bacterium]
MSIAFAVMMGLAALTTLGVLILGVVSMAKGGEFNRKYGNKLMRWRVGLQALALTFFVLAMVSGRTPH